MNQRANSHRKLQRTGDGVIPTGAVLNVTANCDVFHTGVFGLRKPAERVLTMRQRFTLQLFSISWTREPSRDY